MLCEKDSEMAMSSCRFFPCLTDIITIYLDMYDKAGKLADHGVIALNQIWIKLGGDHGGGSFKFVFQVANIDRPMARTT